MKIKDLEDKTAIKIGIALVFHVAHILAKDQRSGRSFDEAEEFIKEAEKRLAKEMPNDCGN